MTNFFKNNYGIFINIFGLITVFLIIYIALNINLNNKDNNNDDIDDYLVSLGLKEDNITKDFILPGGAPMMLPIMFSKMLLQYYLLHSLLSSQNIYLISQLD